MTEQTTSTEVMAHLKNVLWSVSYMETEDRAHNDIESDLLANADIRDFPEAGIYGGNDGLVITLADGSEYQITIVRSK